MIAVSRRSGTIIYFSKTNIPRKKTDSFPDYKGNSYIF